MGLQEDMAMAKAIWEDDPAAVEAAWKARPSWTKPLAREAIQGFADPRRLYSLAAPPSLWAIQHRKIKALEALLDLRHGEMLRLGVSSEEGELARDEMALAARAGFLGACQKIERFGWAKPKPWLALSLLMDLERIRGKKTPEGQTWAQALEPVAAWIVSFGGDLDASFEQLKTQATTAREREVLSGSGARESTLMEWAGCGQVAAALIKAGANPDGLAHRRARARSPLECAMRAGRLDWIEELARAGASLEPMFSGEFAQRWRRLMGERFAEKAQEWARQGARSQFNEAALATDSSKPRGARL